MITWRHRAAALAAGFLLLFGLLGPASLRAQDPPGTARVSPPWPPPTGTPQAQGAPTQPPEAPVTVYAFTFRYRSAADAVPLLRPLLSPRGTVELQPSGNTVVVRDTVTTLERIVTFLRAFDRPLERVRIELIIVRAENEPAPPRTDAPAWVTERLRNLLRWNHYSLIAQVAIDSREGEGVTYEFGDGYSVAFDLGSIGQDERLRLGDFRVFRGRGNERRRLLGTNLLLQPGKPTALGLSRGESSSNALMLIMTYTRETSVISPSPSPRAPKTSPRPPGGP